MVDRAVFIRLIDPPPPRLERELCSQQGAIGVGIARLTLHHASTLKHADQDGVNPNDAISKSHTRKSGIFYWSIME